MQRRASFTKPSNHSSFDFKTSPLPRSASAYDSRSPPRHHRNPPVESFGDYDPYAYNDGPFVDEEPLYVPRSTMVDIIYKNDDEILADRHKDEELIELPSGARQRKRRILDPRMDPNMSDSNMANQSEIRKRRNVNPDSDAVSAENHISPETATLQQSNANEDILAHSLLKAGNTMAGLLVMVFLSYHFSSYLYRLHENDLWFSEIMVSINIMVTIEIFYRKLLSSQRKKRILK